ncbi:ABC transporter permease [Streptomyces shenzhenensis]|uniref:ABC transporter permease n=1 Tax=Streptomyces shenzhenensis TaxID=943815 RepID=UPI00382F702F
MTRPPVVRVLMALRVWLILLLGVGVWAAVTAVADVPKYIFPSPRAVVREFAKRSDLYLEAFWVSLLESVAGFVAAAVLGVLLAVLIARSRLMETMLYPYLNIIRVTPTVAVAPLLTIWFGTGTLSVVVVSFLLAFFPVIVQTVLGLNSADPGLVDVMRVCNASELSILRKVRLPTALPYVFSSFRISAPAAVIGVLAGEFMSGEKGLGYLITVMSAQLNTPAVFALIILSSILGIGLFEVCVLVEKRLVTWHPSVRL